MLRYDTTREQIRFGRYNILQPEKGLNVTHVASLTFERGDRETRSEHDLIDESRLSTKIRAIKMLQNNEMRRM